MKRRNAGMAGFSIARDPWWWCPGTNSAVQAQFQLFWKECCRFSLPSSGRSTSKKATRRDATRHMRQHNICTWDALVKSQRRHFVSRTCSEVAHVHVEPPRSFSVRRSLHVVRSWCSCSVFGNNFERRSWDIFKVPCGANELNEQSLRQLQRRRRRRRRGQQEQKNKTKKQKRMHCKKMETPKTVLLLVGKCPWCNEETYFGSFAAICSQSKRYPARSASCSWK